MKIETGYRLQQAKSIPDDIKVLNGNLRINADVLKYRGMGVINRHPGHLSAYPNSLSRSQNLKNI